MISLERFSARVGARCARRRSSSLAGRGDADEMNPLSIDRVLLDRGADLIAVPI